MIRQRAQGFARGFTLLETLVVIGVFAIIIAAAAVWMQNMARNQTRDTWSQTQAKEMTMLANAVDRVITGNTVAAIQNLSDNTTLSQADTPTVAWLVAQGFLPPNFAFRRDSTGGQAVGTSPLGHPYVIRIRRELPLGSTTQLTRAIIMESGTYLPDAIARTGQQATPGQLAALKTEIATVIERDFDRVAGTIAEGTQTIHSALSNFTLDITAWGIGNATTTWAATFVNFNELDAGITDPDGDGGGPSPGSSCVVLPPSESMNCAAWPTMGNPYVQDNYAVTGLRYGNIGTNTNDLALNTASYVPAGSAVRDETYQANPVGVLVLVGSSTDTNKFKVLAGNRCSALVTPTCPFGKKLSQKIPSKCSNPLRSTARSRFTSSPQIKVTLPGSPYREIRFYLDNNVGGFAPHAMLPDAPDITTLTGASIFSLTANNAYPFQAGDYYFPIISHTPEHITSLAGAGVTGFKYTQGTFVGSAVSGPKLFGNVQSTLTIENQEYSEECMRGYGFRASGSAFGTTYLEYVYRYVPGAHWSVCCDD